MSEVKPRLDQPISVPENVEAHIYLMRGQKVMLDADLASLYHVPTKVLNQAVKRNLDRFPEDFMFQLSPDEVANLRSQIVTSSETAHGGRRYAPLAFTEQGVAMLSSVLKSKQAIHVNIAIMRAFVRMRSILAAHKQLARQLENHDKEITAIWKVIRKLMSEPIKTMSEIGFRDRSNDK